MFEYVSTKSSISILISIPCLSTSFQEMQEYKIRQEAGRGDRNSGKESEEDKEIKGEAGKGGK